jgi:hypothetical protein
VDKVIGFQVLSPRYPPEYRKFGIDDAIQDPELRGGDREKDDDGNPSADLRLPERPAEACQPHLAWGYGNGSIYANASEYNAPIPIALLNMSRSYHNFFELHTSALPDERERTVQKRSSSSQ